MLEIEENECYNCNACTSVCPNNCIELKKSNHGFYLVKVDQEKCIKCNICTKVCPVKEKNELFERVTSKGFKNNDDYIKDKSSSGGAFFYFAQYVINQNGVVYGCVFSEEMEIKHDRATSISDVKKMMKSKYAMSKIEKEIYLSLYEDLKQEKLVLFTGTPCQIAAMNNYIKLKFQIIPENFITIDLICHGTPSPEIFMKYITWLEDKYKSKIVCFDFRSKIKGWRNFSTSAKFANAKSYNSRQNIDPFFILYFRNLILKPACYNCEFTKKERVSDITIGDFWNLEKYNKNFDDDLGTTIIGMTEKGHIFYNNINGIRNDIDISWADYTQPQLFHPVDKNKRYEEFWEYYYKNDFYLSIKKYADYTLLGRIKRFIINVLIEFNLYSIILKLAGKTK